MRVQRLDERRIKRAAQRDGLRKTRSADGRVAVQAFLVKDHRNAQPGVPDEKLLDGIGQLRHFARVSAPARVAGPADLADAAAVLERRPGFF
jgi:hypothetical protein